MEKEVEMAKQLIVEETKKSGLEVKTICLFGSRAMGNCTKNSDWDFYVIVDKDLDFTHKRKLNAQIRTRLAEIRIPNDILIQSQSVAEKRKNEDTVKNWITKAENDLKIDKDEIITGNPATDEICFHMPQCVEEYLKAYLIYHRRREYCYFGREVSFK